MLGIYALIAGVVLIVGFSLDKETCRASNKALPFFTNAPCWFCLNFINDKCEAIFYYIVFLPDCREL
jgi:hypothetical protein